MRIKSPFRDYYDHAQAFGQDADLVYVRNRKEGVRLQWDVPASSDGQNFGERNQHMDTQTTTIGFCGRLYPVCKLSAWLNNSNRRTAEATCVRIEDVDAFVDETFKPEFAEAYRLVKPWDHRGKRTLEEKAARKLWPESHSRLRFVGMFGMTERNGTKYQCVFEELKVPIFAAVMVHKDHRAFVEATLNPALREYDFARVKEPFTAFQEISMFLGNMAWPNRPIPHVSDADLIAAKGFDKFSFRKDPAK